MLAHHGPVAAAVDATNWQYYVGGVIQWNCDANNNHAIQVHAFFRPLDYLVWYYYKLFNRILYCSVDCWLR